MRAKASIEKTIRHRFHTTRFDFARLLRWALVLVLYLTIYSLLDLFTQPLQLFPGVVAWYPPDGLSLAFLLAFGTGFIPAVALASLISSLIIYRFSTPLESMLIWAVILSGAYGIDALLLRRRARIDPQLKTMRDTLWLILSSSVVSTVLAVISVSSLVHYGKIPASQYFYALAQWWIGEMIGILVLAPFLLIHGMPWVKRFVAGEWPNSKTRMVLRRPSLQTLAQIISMPIILYLIFGIPVQSSNRPFFLVAIPLVWIVLTHGFSGISIANVVMNFGTIYAIWLFKFDTSRLGEFQFLMFGIYVSALLTGAIVTRQKQAEEELRKKEIHNRALIENAPDGIALVGADGMFKYVSPSTQRILGYGPEDHLGSNPAELTHPDDLPALLTRLAELSQTPGMVMTTQYRFRHQDGTWRWLESTITNLYAEPSVEAIVINFRDITGRKQADEALQKSEKRFRALVEHSLEEVSMVDAQGTLIYESPTSRRPLGYPPNAFVGFNLFNIIHPDDRAAAAKVMEDIVKQPGSVKEALFRLQHQDGTWRWMEGFLSNLIDEPAVQSVVINYRDVTERKHAEEKIIVSNDELSMLFKLSHSLAEADNLEDILNLINRHAVESIHTTYARIALLEDGHYIMRGAYPHRVLDCDLRVGERNPVSALPYAQRILELNEPVILRASDPGISSEEKKVLLLDFTQTLCLIPLRISDSAPMSENLMGLLMLGEARNEGREPFTPDKIRLAQTIGDSAAIAIRRILLREQTKRRMQQLVALSEIDLAIISSADVSTSLGVLLVQVVEQLKVDAADVWLFNKNLQLLEFVAGRGFQTPAFESAKPLHLGVGNAGRAALERRTVHIPNLRAYDLHPRLKQALEEEPFISYFAVPLIVKDQVKGVLEIFHRTELESSEEWLKFLHALANQAAIAIDNSSLFNDLQHSNAELTQAYDATIQGWSRALDLRDNETEGHTKRVTELTTRLGRRFGLSEEELVHVRRGSLLHDIGKMGVPDRILLKPGPLTDEEWLIMKQHATFAYELLAPIHYLRPALDIPYCHHEKWDGTGYPRGLKGEQIPFAARIFAVVDVWDALTSDRPYRAAWSEEKVLEYIRSLSGVHFDPQVVKICLETGMLKDQPHEASHIEPVQWSETFSVGVKELDRQHQQLVNLLNRLITSTGTVSPHSETISNIFMEITRYAQVHFKAEERLMEAYGYPGLEEQKKQHRDFCKKTSDLSTSAYLGVEHVPEALLAYLTDWWIHHILEEDMAYRSFFKENNVE